MKTNVIFPLVLLICLVAPLQTNFAKTPESNDLDSHYIQAQSIALLSDSHAVKRLRIGQQNTGASDKARQNQCSDGRGLAQGIQFEVFIDAHKREWVSPDKLKEYIKICDETIRENPNQSLPYYTRGLARYYLIRGFVKPMINTLSDTQNVSTEDLRLSLTDLRIYIGKQVDFNAKSKNGVSSEELKMAYLASGELTAVSGVKGESAELLHSAIEQWNAGEKLKTLSDAYDGQLNTVMIADRDMINRVLAEAAGPTGAKGPPADDAKTRYQKYAGEYAALETVYKTKVQAFQETLKAQQAASNPDPTKVCLPLNELSTSFQSMKNSFAKISDMRTKGELTVDLVKQVEMREAQHTKVQASITAAAVKYSCQLK